MYSRRGQHLKEFSVMEKNEELVNGRSKTEYIPRDGLLKATLADATPYQKEEWKQLQHPISHIVVQKGAPELKEGDRLVRGNKYYDIQGIANPGALNRYTFYYALERPGLNEQCGNS